MQPTETLRNSDLAVVGVALDALERADTALDDLREHLRAKEDTSRVGRVRIAQSRLGEARQIVEHAFR